MKTWDELTPDQQDYAIERGLADLVEMIVETPRSQIEGRWGSAVLKAYDEARDYLEPGYTGKWRLSRALHDRARAALVPVAVKTVESWLFTGPGDPYVMYIPASLCPVRPA